MMRASGLGTHGELVAWLKAEHGFGHGHANAITIHSLAEGTTRGTDDELIASLFTGKKAHWRALYDDLIAEISAFGDVKILPKKTLVGVGVKSQFAMLQPSTPDRFDIGLKFANTAPTARLEAAGSWNTMMTHRVRLTDAAQVDAELLAWLKAAYDRVA